MAINTVIVSENPELWEFIRPEIAKVSAIDYLTGDCFTDNSPKRIINLCSSYQYQSIGYYVSLLAEARNHKVFPSVMAIQDMKATNIQFLIDTNLNQDIQHLLKSIKSDTFELSIYFGKNMAQRYSALCRKLYGLIPLPLFRVHFKKRKNWSIQKITPLSLLDIHETHYSFLVESANHYFSKKRYDTARRKTSYYTVAILVNSNDKCPPSCKDALKKFINAGARLGITMELIEKDSYKSLTEYDGLFIRDTTSVNHYTYRFSRKAHAENLVVIDDPISILRCTNKVYLAELLNKNGIDAPKTTILSKHDWKTQIQSLDLPCVLKVPDGSFSHGVIKVETQEQLKKGLTEVFRNSDLIIAQAFLPSEFDWRIGILDNKPLYACRYYMAHGHWQIYNWQSTEHQEGGFDTLPLAKVPKIVLNTAKKVTKLIGDGLYGVDLKQIGKKVYVIEVNDNPSIESGVEDLHLGDELYNKIMLNFLKRLDNKHGYN